MKMYTRVLLTMGVIAGLLGAHGFGDVQFGVNETNNSRNALPDMPVSNKGDKPANDKAFEILTGSLRLFTVVSQLNSKTDPKTRVLACMQNVGLQPIRIYTPGFVGEIWSQSNPSGVPIPLRGAPRENQRDNRDFVWLRQYEVFARGDVSNVTVEEFTQKYDARCHYVCYDEGNEGERDAIKGVIYIDRVVEKRLGNR